MTTSLFPGSSPSRLRDRGTWKRGWGKAWSRWTIKNKTRPRLTNIVSDKLQWVQTSFWRWRGSCSSWTFFCKVTLCSTIVTSPVKTYKQKKLSTERLLIEVPYWKWCAAPSLFLSWCMSSKGEIVNTEHHANNECPKRVYIATITDESLGPKAFLGLSSNLLSPTPPRHPTNIVKRVYPEFFSSFNIV